MPIGRYTCALMLLASFAAALPLESAIEPEGERIPEVPFEALVVKASLLLPRVPVFGIALFLPQTRQRSRFFFLSLLKGTRPGRNPLPLDHDPEGG